MAEIVINNHIIERNQAVEHAQEKSELMVENAKLLTRIEDLHFENRLTLHQIEMYEKFLPARVQPVQIGEVIDKPLINGHYLCATPTGLQWTKVPQARTFRQVRIYLTTQ